MIRLPHVHQYVSVAVRANLGGLSKNSLYTAARRYASYLTAYYLVGGSLRHRLLSITGLSVDDPLDNVFSLLNPSLALRAILIGGACVFTMRMSNLLFKLYQLKVIICCRFGLTGIHSCIFLAYLVSS